MAVQRLKGFNSDKVAPKHRLVVSATGHEKSGKTHFGLGAPGPIALLDFDTGLEGVVEKFQDIKQIHQATFPKPKPGDEVGYKRVWSEFLEAYDEALKASWVRSIHIDTGTEMWENARLNFFGKRSAMPYEYGPVNAAIRDIIRKVFDTNKNLIITHKVKQQYVNDKWNGMYERAGFKDIPFLVQTNLFMDRDVDTGEFTATVSDCRQNMTIAGMELRGEMCSFSQLAMQVFPDSEPEEWE